MRSTNCWPTNCRTPRSGGELFRAQSCECPVDDAVFVDLSIAAKVDMLVSGGRHLTELGDDSPVRVVKPDELRTNLG